MALTFRTPLIVLVLYLILTDISFSPFITHVKIPRLRWTFAASLYGRSHRSSSPSVLGEKFLNIISQQLSLKKCVLIWKATRQLLVVPANIKYSMILWFILLLLYHFFVMFCLLNSPSFAWDIPAMISKQPSLLITVDNAIILSHACNLDIINSYSCPLQMPFPSYTEATHTFKVCSVYHTSDNAFPFSLPI